MKIVLVAGARPNFPKIAPIAAELRKQPERFEALVVHTGQHYDYNLSQVFFDDLELPPPDFTLDARRDDPTAQMGDILVKFAGLLSSEAPDLVIVVGDTTSTVACALAAASRGIAVGHVEAGLRSRDRTMPEEIHRMATDAVADMLFTYSADADANLREENVPETSIFRVGNVMIDTLMRFRDRASESDILARVGVPERGYVLVTMHRPANVDDPVRLRGLVEALVEVSRRLPLVFPVHPRTRNRLEDSGLIDRLSSEPGVHLEEPVGYVEMLRLQASARLAMVDSGGIQEETTVLGVPCLTMRQNTERPVTITEGTNRLVGCDGERVRREALAVLEDDADASSRPVPDLWDGRAAERLVQVLSRGIVRR
ncbi:MAG: UDP-N-acetylglucosamine 2-epimerase (non-hydrolyzing) [Candidatus Latescibacteria bacterium]|jgi:UDP-N-acetylglucosamine 2-epimerase (non-hydrolysing)|nr:UDP-N-acetylglucosamine 2-epimerase (non-hydrolyzing) [Candidatus Latescibacterota bacterium]